MYKYLSIAVILLLSIDLAQASGTKANIIVSARYKLYCLDDSGNFKWSFPTPGQGQESGPAIGDVDNDGKGEIFFGARDSLYCLTYDGTRKWARNVPQSRLCSPVIANIDTIGDPEVIIASQSAVYCFNSVTGGVEKWSYPISGSYCFGDLYIGPAVSVANVDTIGTPEVIVATPTVFYCIKSDGTLGWSHDINISTTNNQMPGVAVADLGTDGVPEIIGASDYDIVCFRPNGTYKWTYVGTAGKYLGQPAIADINNDSKAEIVVYEYPQVVAYQENVAGTGITKLWSDTIVDATAPIASCTPPVICNIDGDSDKDVLFVGCTYTSHPIGYLYIFNGTDGKHPDNSGNPPYKSDLIASRTLCERGVAIADIDEDGHLEIVGISSTNAWNDICGIAVLENDANWADSRNLFTSHLYHTTEINDNLTIPRIEPSNWKSHNTWVTQLTTGGSGLGTPTLKWTYADSTFGWINASIAIAPLGEIAATEENVEPATLDLRMFYRNNHLVIKFNSGKNETLNLAIFDITGRLIRTQEFGQFSAGKQEIHSDFSGFANGIYFVRIHSGKYESTNKIVLVR